MDQEGDLPVHSCREKVEKAVAERVAAGFVTDIIVIFKPEYGRSQQRILKAREPEARDEKIRVLEAAMMKSLDAVAGALLKRGPSRSIPSLPVALAASSANEATGSGQMMSSWLTNSVSLLASPDWIKKLASHRLVTRIVTNKMEKLARPFRTPRTAAPSTPPGAAWGLRHIGIPDLWAEGLTGRGVSVGHLDTGVDASHPDLEGRVAQWEAFDQFGNALTGTPRYDSGFHGTHTAGIIAGGAAGGTAIGIAPAASLSCALVLPQGTGTTKQIVRGMEWCLAQGVDVLNLSLGGSGYNEAYEPAVRHLRMLGTFPAFSVGNAGLGVTGSPANHRDACAVGALNERDEVADFSGGGAFAWSDNDVYVKPDLCAPGVAIHSAIPTPYVRETGSDPYDTLDGTSMAAPHVSGTVALLWEAFPYASAAQIQEALFATCRPLGLSFHNMHSGRGLIQPVEALRKLERIVRASKSRPRRASSSKIMNRAETINLPHPPPAKVAGG